MTIQDHNRRAWDAQVASGCVWTVPVSDEEIARRFEAGIPLEFGHTLEDQIGGQLDAGFLLAGFFEDTNRLDGQEPLDRFMPQYIATRAVKPA